MKHNRLYKLYLTDSISKNVFVGNWTVQKCAEDEARHYLKLFAHSMRIEVIDMVTMKVISDYEINRREVYPW